MSKPEDIPQDIWDDTRHALSDGFTSPIPNYDMAVRVARAILAERERWELIELPCCAHEFYMMGYDAGKATR